MKIWAIANQKGGVGKTTTTVSLAGWLVQSGKSVLVADLDPHASLTGYFGFDPEALELSIYDLFAGDDRMDVGRIMLETKVGNLALLPAAPAMATLDRQLGTQQGQGLVLAGSLENLVERFDYVLLDCPPTLGVLMINALAACELVIVPTQTEYLALNGLERMQRTLAMVNKARPRYLRHLIVPTIFDRRTRASIQVLRKLREQYGEHLWNQVIPVDTQFREASKAGLPLPQMDRASRGARAFKQLLEDIEYLQNKNDRDAEMRRAG